MQGGLVAIIFTACTAVIPAKAGEPVHTNACVYWIPAFAGMTAVDSCTQANYL
jgi:hypothetical protein